ncbi:hypothetical protein NIES2119_10830 [[Phormidium ambiguum] IAM M-71]|uniref:Filamentous haemagglutinin FhaB/tRNA nuclease CdiA-like TPS domain-containing protein n=1 Tax=[Phormidium ambiguum] IAM M-71 TaxID=454136 RepID=A0A1U7ILI7_9CYAN|nr:filamentous hemagglutinin N-terminal domain-containing protein [Phormidium ambiguum]OKH38050.1 hypothetical protein NIES2119_10830 [Phormidium ambiguum IAM M-71]
MKPSPSLLHIAQSSALLILLISYPTTAQIIPDNTVNTTVTPNGNINVIEGGTRAGNNLFHSFQEFSIPTGSEAFFNNAFDIRNIFSRVTGRSISNIDGLIRANGIANLFLLNPNGIIFGQNARLNIGGSFLATTANSFKFADGIEFSATNPQTAPLLSVNVPIGLQYGKNAAEIRVQGKGQDLGFATESFDSSLNPLEVLPGKTLTFVGGNVVVDGGILQAPGGRVEIGGITGEGTVGLNADGSLSFPEGVVLSDISITNKAGINVIASGGGSITITGRNLDISGESLLTAGIAAGKGSVDAVAGDISLNASEVINISSSRIENNVNPVDSKGIPSIGNSGDIIIQTGSLYLIDGVLLDSSTFGQGNAGNVKITATDTVSFDGGSRALSAVRKEAIGSAGGIEIITKSLFVTGDSLLATSTLGKGNAGNVKITATDTVSFDGGSRALSSVAEGAIGNGGSIEIITKSLTFTSNAQLVADTDGQGNAGSVKITATDTVSFDVRGAFSTVSEKAIGNGGSIEITAKSLSVTNGALLSSSTLGKGNAGSVKITASDSVSFDGVDSNGYYSGAFSTVETEAIGNGGDIDITTRSLSLTNGAELSATSEGNGAAGNINLKANSIRLSDEAYIIADTVKGQGNITMESQSLIMRRGSNITTNATGKATGGNITINTDVLAALENSDISANAEDSFGGRVIINAQGIFGTKFRPDTTPESDITATSKLGPQFSGTVQINTPEVDPNSGLVNLPENAVDVSRLVPKGCVARRKETGAFYITGNGGFQYRPGDGFVSPLPTGEVRSIPEGNTSNNSQLNERLIEAQGVYQLENGEMVLGWECPK